MTIWWRLLITVLAILLTSFLASYASANWLGLTLPGYVSGLIGGLVALPVWEFLARAGAKRRPEQEY